MFMTKKSSETSKKKPHLWIVNIGEGHMKGSYRGIEMKRRDGMPKGLPGELKKEAKKGGYVTVTDLGTYSPQSATGEEVIPSLGKYLKNRRRFYDDGVVINGKLISYEGLKHWVTEGLAHERRGSKEYAHLSDGHILEDVIGAVGRMSYFELDGTFRRLCRQKS